MAYKIVLNRCFGGYGVSEQGARWLLANGASPEKVSVIPAGTKGYSWTCVSVDLHRHDPLLVKMVKTLGEQANGDCAKLEVVEIDQPLYRIDEYDGSESIEEPGQATWVNAATLEA
jgi:hypothetical protein